MILIFEDKGAEGEFFLLQAYKMPSETSQRRVVIQVRRADIAYSTTQTRRVSDGLGGDAIVMLDMLALH